MLLDAVCKEVVARSETLADTCTLQAGATLVSCIANNSISVPLSQSTGTVLSNAMMTRVISHPEEATPYVIRTFASALVDLDLDTRPPVLDEFESIGFAQLSRFNRDELIATATAYKKLGKPATAVGVKDAFVDDDDCNFAELLRLVPP